MPRDNGQVVPGGGSVPAVQAPAHDPEPSEAELRVRLQGPDPARVPLSPHGTLADVPLPAPVAAPAAPGTPHVAGGLRAPAPAATVPLAAGQGTGREADEIADNPMGGVKYDRAKPRIDLIPAPLLLELAKLFGMGAEKYAPRNWEQGFEWHRNYNGAMRHLLAWWSGEDDDPENGQPHLIAAIWNLIVLRHFERMQAGTDDRPDHGPPPEEG